VDPFITHTGRAMPLRRGGLGTGQISRDTGATILIAGPGCGIGSWWPGAGREMAGNGFRAMISARFDEILYNDMIQAGIVLAQLPANVVDGLLQTVEANPGILLSIDLRRREVRAGSRTCVVFAIDECARQRLMAGRDALADRLQAAQRSLASRDLGAVQRSRLQRRLMAICDAIKVPGADMAHDARRLDKFLGDLGRADGDEA
jgi:3-isopropylmalate/(R)-2-methylmalate dehydratase small subunit